MVGVTLLHGRPGITRLFALHMADIGVPWVAAVTEGDEACIAIAKEFAHKYVEISNDRLDKKWNNAMVLSRGMGKAVILGSDDLVSKEWLDYLEDKEFDYALPMSTAFLDMETERVAVLEASHVSPKTGRAPRFGAGRVVAEHAIEHCKWRTGARRGLDGNNYRMLRARKLLGTSFDFPRIPVTDLKTPDNTWQYDQLLERGRPGTMDEALWMCSGAIRDEVLSFARSCGTGSATEPPSSPASHSPGPVE